ncbi:MAG: hypothetical protein ABIN48_11165 [Ginsengibacter sp.]
MKKIIIPILLFVSCSSTCKKNPFVERVYSIKVANDADYACITFESRIYPDTALPANVPYYSTAFPEDYAVIDSKTEWSNVYKKFPADTLSIFILNSDTVKVNEWGIIRSGYKILKRYDLSLEDLKKLNWTITYPAPEAMRNIKQYPPY